MPKKGHTEEQILAALHQVEGGEKIPEEDRGRRPRDRRDWPLSILVRDFPIRKH